MHPSDSVLEIKRRHEEFETVKKALAQRVNVVRTGLEQVGLLVEELSTHRIIELFYKTYNPGVSREEKIESLEEDDVETEVISA